MEVKKKLNEIILLRVFAILIVVLGHSMIIYSDRWNLYSTPINSNFYNNLKRIIDVFQMPLFIFVSGYIYRFNRIEQGKYENFSMFVLNKFFRLIVPFLSVGILFVIPIRLFVKYDGYVGISFSDIVLKKLILGTDSGNLWFLPTLFFIFCIFYLLEKYVKKMHILLNLTLMLILSIISLKLPAVLFISKIFYYFLFFYFGYAVRSIVNCTDRLVSYKMLLLFGLVSACGIISDFYIGNDNLILKIISTGVILISGMSSILFFYISFSKLDESFKKVKDNLVVKIIDRDSFGIYLFHSPLMYPIFSKVNDFMIPPTVLVLFLFIYSLILSIFLTFIIRKTKVFKFVIGEGY